MSEASSLPGFHTYPTYRDVNGFHKTAKTWLAGKRADDKCGGGLWRIEDKLYDFSTFVTSHPGGADWLKMTQGTDITEAFEVHHFSTVPRNIIRKFYVKNVNFPRNSPYSFDENGFYKCLKRKVVPILDIVGHGPSLSMLIIQDCLLLAFIITLYTSGFFSSYLLSFLSGIILVLLTISSHNFFHCKDNWRMYMFDMSCLSHYDWRITHVLSHHIFPNTIQDWEISGSEPVYQFLPSKNKTWLNKYGVIFYFHILNSFTFLQVFKKIGEIPNWSSFLPLTQILTLCISNNDIYMCLKLWLLIHITFGYFFVLISLTGGHHLDDVFHDGDESCDRNESRDNFKTIDWGLHQIHTVKGRFDGSSNLFLVSTLFGNHLLHHLFPTVDQSKLHYLEEPLLETCKEFGIELKRCSVFESIIGLFKQLARTHALKM